MICASCFIELEDHFRYCPACGKKIIRPKLPIIPEMQIETPKEMIIIKQIDPILKPEEAAEFLKISPSHIYSLVAKGEIPHFFLGKPLRFKTHELLAWQGTRGGDDND